VGVGWAKAAEARSAKAGVPTMTLCRANIRWARPRDEVPGGLAHPTNRHVRGKLFGITAPMRATSRWYCSWSRSLQDSLAAGSVEHRHEMRSSAAVPLFHPFWSLSGVPRTPSAIPGAPWSPPRPPTAHEIVNPNWQPALDNSSY